VRERGPQERERVREKEREGDRWERRVTVYADCTQG